MNESLSDDFYVNIPIRSKLINTFLNYFNENYSSVKLMQRRTRARACGTCTSLCFLSCIELIDQILCTVARMDHSATGVIVQNIVNVESSSSIASPFRQTHPDNSGDVK